MAEWLGTGLQNLLQRFDSAWYLKKASGRWSGGVFFVILSRPSTIGGITQEELAFRMGVSPQYVGRILKGQENLTLAVIAKIEKALQLTILNIGIEEPVEAGVSEDVID